MKKVSIISNDKRYQTVNTLFLKNGYESKIETVNTFSGCDILILSVKNEYARDEIETLFKKAEPNTIIFKGDYETPKAEKVVCNYAKDENFVLKNAYLTAQATFPFIKEHIKIPIELSKALVLGYGRIGKYLAEMLKNNGAETFVYARREEARKEAEKNGILSTETPADLYKYNFVFNTVPEIIVPKSETDKAYQSGTLMVELASMPGGFEDESVALNGGGLPGKMLPQLAGNAVYETILEFLSSNVAERTVL
jgi:dipicolinate synthase subunit A